MSFKQSILDLPLIMSVYQETAKWISLDWWTLGKRVMTWSNFNETFSLKRTRVKAINKSSHLSKIKKKNPAKEVHFW